MPEKDGLEETGEIKAWWRPELPGERIIREGGTPPKYIPEQGPLSYKGYERTDTLIIWDERTGQALAAFNLGAHDDPEEPLDVMRVELDLIALNIELGTHYSVKDAPLKQDDFEKLQPVVVYDTEELGIKRTSDYTGDQEVKG